MCIPMPAARATAEHAMSAVAWTSVRSHLTSDLCRSLRRQLCRIRAAFGGGALVEELLGGDDDDASSRAAGSSSFAKRRAANTDRTLLLNNGPIRTLSFLSMAAALALVVFAVAAQASHASVMHDASAGAKNKEVVWRRAVSSSRSSGLSHCLAGPYSSLSSKAVGSNSHPEQYTFGPVGIHNALPCPRGTRYNSVHATAGRRLDLEVVLVGLVRDGVCVPLLHLSLTLEPCIRLDTSLTPWSSGRMHSTNAPGSSFGAFLAHLASWDERRFVL